MGDNMTNESGGGNISFADDERCAIDINICGRSDFSTDQKLAHELKHAYQFENEELGWIPNSEGNYRPFMYDMNDEYEAFSRQNLFASKPSQVVSDVWSLVNNRYDYLPLGPIGMNNFPPVIQSEYRNRSPLIVR